MDFPCEAFRDAGRSAAGDRHCVDIAKQRKCERPAIGRHVDIDPRTLVGANGHFLQHRACRRHDIPLFGAGFLARNRHGSRRCIHNLAATVRRQCVLRGIDLLLLDRIGARLGILRVGGSRAKDQREGGGNTRFHDGLSPGNTGAT